MNTDLSDIAARNARVEADKAWETSKARRLMIVMFTYVIANIYLYFLGVENFYLHAAVPAGGYLLSTLTLPLAKKAWLKKHFPKQK